MSNERCSKINKTLEKVGYTHFDRWFCFAAYKNNLNDTLRKLRRNETGDILKTKEKLMKEIRGKLELIKTEPEKDIIIRGYKVKLGLKLLFIFILFRIYQN